MTKIRFEKNLLPNQGRGPRVVSFVATAEDVERIARIERVTRDKAGKLSGFQRPAIHAHIREIREYLSREDAILPNAIVLAFAGGAAIEADGSLVIDTSEGPPGWVVDGQQRLTAALYHKDSGFELVISAFICEHLTELNKQFILINNVKPLSKHLVYELLPGVEGLPHRLSDRSGAALLTEALNYRSDSSLYETIRQQTNPGGVIRDTILQKMLINSMAQGALRDMETDSLLEDGYSLTRNFFAGVKSVFREDWINHTPKSSRLVHGVGIVAMGYAMDELAAAGARSEREFADGLEPLRGQTHWTKGEWNFGDHRRPWNTLQNTNADFQLVSHYLMRVLRRASREAVLLEAAE